MTLRRAEQRVVALIVRWCSATRVEDHFNGAYALAATRHQHGAKLVIWDI